MVASAVVASALLLGPAVSFADEYGVEVDAPTLFTGEEVMVRLLKKDSSNINDEIRRPLKLARILVSRFAKSGDLSEPVPRRKPAPGKTTMTVPRLTFKIRLQPPRKSRLPCSRTWMRAIR